MQKEGEEMNRGITSLAVSVGLFFAGLGIIALSLEQRRLDNRLRQAEFQIESMQRAAIQNVEYQYTPYRFGLGKDTDLVGYYDGRQVWFGIERKF